MKKTITTIALLLGLISSVRAEIVTKPTFTCCSVELKSADAEGCKLEYKAPKGVWTAATNGNNIMGLKENTTYEVRFVKDGRTVESSKFTTWRSDVHVGKTIVIDPEKFEAPLTISEKGTPDSWIRYTVKGGTLVNGSDKPTFIIEGAEYVLIDDMTLRGAVNSTRAILVQNCLGLRIRNCDIAGWGREGVQNFQRLTGEKRYGPGNGSYVDRNGEPINLDPAIDICKGAKEVVVERCFIHDPVSRSVSWYYHHPEGPNAIAVSGPESTVIRWNDFIGSDRHRWNDAVEGPGNFSEHGGINRDADVYGNFMIFANDDCIELDGGQRNVRCFGNRFESALCGVSVQGCMVGPSFVYDNWFTGMEEEFAMYGQTVKTGGGQHGKNSRSYIYNNTFWGRGVGIMERENLGSVVTDNRFCDKQTLKKSEKAVRASDSGNVFGVKIDEADIDTSYPQRPLGFTLSRARIDVGMSREDQVIKINGKLPKGCVIRKPDAMDWFNVEIGKNSLTIKFDDAKMQRMRYYRGAFILRTPDGLSRPVSVYAKTNYIPPFKSVKPGIYAQYIEGFSLKPGEKKSVKFTIEKAGRYWIMLHGKATQDYKSFESRHWPHPMGRVDNEPYLGTVENMMSYPTWVMFNPKDDVLGSFVHHYDLTAGEHTVDIDATADKTKYSFDGMVITNDPAAFEPNRID